MAREITAPIIACSRLRMKTDGEGITTLVCFHGCPLRCKYCINQYSFDKNTKTKILTPKELFDEVKIDNLYFLATGGGVTFGGGEPLLYPEFLKEFSKLCKNQWHLCVETSLNVPTENVKIACEFIDVFYVDIKDINNKIYKSYTTRDNKQVINNINILLQNVGTQRIIARLPLIEGYNNNSDREKSKEFLSSMGIEKFDLFTYKTNQ